MSMLSKGKYSLDGKPPPSEIRPKNEISYFEDGVEQDHVYLVCSDTLRHLSTEIPIDPVQK